MHSLPLFVRLGGRPVILVGEGEAAEAKARLLRRAGAEIVGEQATAQLAIVIDDEAAVARLKARGILVNAVDRPALCDFTLPAIVDRDPVLIAIGTGGASAGLAKALRQRLEALLPATLGALADGLQTARARLRDRFPDGDARRRAIDAMLSPGAALDPFGPAGDVDATIGGRHDEAPPRVERVAVASTDPDELTLRAARLLGQADRVHHPADMPGAILDRARADAVRLVGPAPAIPLAGLTVELRWAR